MTVRPATEAIACMGLAFLLMAPSLADGLPGGTSHHFNAAWSQGFSEQFAAGEPYPRWIASMWHGAGAPDFFFYPPLAFWLGAMAALLPGIDPPAGLGIGAALLLGLSGIGMTRLARDLDLPGPPLAAGLALMLMPYHLGNWYAREAAAEFAAFAVLPFLISALLRTTAGRRGAVADLALWSGLMALAHLPAAVLAALAVPPALLAAGTQRDPRSLARVLAGVALGLGLAAIYWLPALALLDPGSADWLRRIAWRDHMLRPFGASLAPIWQPFLWFSVAAALVLAGLPTGRGGRLAAGLIGATWLLVTPLSAILWDLLPIGILQFPWRSIGVAETGVALLAPPLIAAFARGAALHRAAGALALAAAAGGASGHALLERDRHPVSAEALAARAGPMEWLPPAARDALALRGMAGYRAALAALARQPLVTAPPGATVSVLAEAPRRLVVEVGLDAPGTVTFRHAAWPHWRLRRADGTPVPLAATAGFPHLTAELPAGRAAYALELPPTPPERAGLALSMLSAIAVAGLALSARRSRGEG